MRDLQVVEGMPAHFEAKLVPVGDPRLRVEWYKDGRPIQVRHISFSYRFQKGILTQG